MLNLSHFPLKLQKFPPGKIKNRARELDCIVDGSEFKVNITLLSCSIVKFYVKFSIFSATDFCF